MIPSLFRFHGHNSLRYVYANGKAVRTQLITIKYVRNTHRTHPRFSIVVSKKVLKSAVGRNRIRRRLYEYVRPHIKDISHVHDVVVIATSSDIRHMPADELKMQLDQAFTKAELFLPQ
jgi:ribonuclease P protein component